jgi:hypothetical protein
VVSVRNDKSLADSFECAPGSSDYPTKSVDMRMYTHCVEAIRTAITALAGPTHAGSAKPINRDCANDGTLKYLYPLAALRAAWHNMTDEMVMYTHCRGVIGTEIHMITGR